MDAAKTAPLAGACLTLGAGILALSAGQAAGTGWIPSILICAGLGALSAHSFSIVGTACEELGQQDFKVRAAPCGVVVR
jgi:amino acid permease